MRSLDLGVEGADNVVQHLNTDVVPPHAGARTPRLLIRGLENLKGAEPAGKKTGFWQAKEGYCMQTEPRKQLVALTNCLLHQQSCKQQSTTVAVAPLRR